MYNLKSYRLSSDLILYSRIVNNFYNYKIVNHNLRIFIALIVMYKIY